MASIMAVVRVENRGRLSIADIARAVDPRARRDHQKANRANATKEDRKLRNGK
jgi:hypothetical protein